jgi:hypothetical protein
VIEDLRVAKTANFYRLNRRLSTAAIAKLFRTIRAAHANASQNHFSESRVASGAARWSALSFLYDRHPAFLRKEADVQERVGGFVLLVEHRDLVAIFKSGLEIPAGFATRYLGRVPGDRVDVAVARQDAIFEKIRLRNTSISKQAMRNKTFEADDLRDVVGPAGASRYAPQGYRVRSGEDHFSTTPSTGRISQRSDRVDHLTLIEYAKGVIDELAAGVGDPSPFIRTFARSVDLASIEGVARPTMFAVDVAGLSDALYERGEVRLVRPDGDAYVELAKAEIDLVLAELGIALEVRGKGKKPALHDPAGAEVGAIALNKARVALRDLRLPLSGEVEVEASATPVGDDPNRMSLRRYIDGQDGFLLLFDQLRYTYIDGALFRDDALVDGGADFLRYLRPEPLLAKVNDEKGKKFTEQQTAFDVESTFGVVVATVADGDEVLVCDDLGDEWADFIGLTNSSSPPRITFYHAKHGDLSLGATPFHESVGQALKNLRSMALPRETMGGKINGWRKNYKSGKGVQTAIPRILRGDPNGLADEFAQARMAPDAIRRVMIVTSSLSKGAVTQALVRIKEGRRPDPYFVQLYWLLLSFFSACTDMNAFGYVVCRE